ncbi:uncharacterized protein J3R85_019943 [Psidium guajava]|nr:uncharacterized protein J3R85_019943 [Psidium guajava]
MPLFLGLCVELACASCLTRARRRPPSSSGDVQASWPQPQACLLSPSEDANISL